MRIDVIHANVPPRGKLSEARIKSIKTAGLPGTEIVIRLPDKGVTSISSRYEDALSAPGVLAMTLQAERDGADAVVINCTADTGVEAAREAVSIPVIGVSEASFYLAAQLAHRFSVLTFADRTALRFETMAHQWNLSHKLASVRSVEMPLETSFDEAELAGRLAQAAQACVTQDGAHLLILGCTDFERVSDLLTKQLAAIGICLPIVQPFLVGVQLAESLVTMGLSFSKLTYPKANLKS